VEQVLERLAALDPSALPLLGRLVPWWAGVALAALGLAFAVAGSSPALRRVVAALAGGVAGWFLVPAAARHLGVPFAHAGPIGATALAIAGLVRPAAPVIVAGALGGGLLALHFWPGRLLRAALPGAIGGGLAAGLFRQSLLSLSAAAVGAVLTVIGAASILLRTGASGSVHAYPIAFLAGAGLLFICAAAYQLTRHTGGRKHVGPAMPTAKRRAG
jgi:hypothetical protein